MKWRPVVKEAPRAAELRSSGGVGGAEEIANREDNFVMFSYRSSTATPPRHRQLPSLHSARSTAQ